MEFERQLLEQREEFEKAHEHMTMQKQFLKQIMASQNGYVKNIMELRVTTGANPRKVKEFYKQLYYNVQSMDMREGLWVAKENVRSTLDKLKGVKADLVRGNEGKRDWDFKDLLRELKKMDRHQSC